MPRLRPAATQVDAYQTAKLFARLRNDLDLRLAKLLRRRFFA
jgi:hypothetical protein